MRKAEAQHSHAQSQPVAKQGRGAVFESPQGEQLAQLESMAESSPQVNKLAQLAAMANSSLQLATQRQQLDSFNAETAQREEAPAKPNNTGLPDSLKNGIESLSGISMDNVKVHYNSSQPAQLNAHAYAQGTDIHVAPGQEQHLPHEAWHVVQQAQGRVQPTMQMKEGVPVNDDQSLEHEADVMGGRAGSYAAQEKIQLKTFSASHAIVQRAVAKTGERTEDNPVTGEMNYSFKWAAVDPHHNGFIIQQVDRTETRSEGDGEPVVDNYVYWEAWKVVDGVIFNGDMDISGIQHDSWFNQGMPASSHGTIQMECEVYFSPAEALEGMGHGTVAMAGQLLSSNEEPAGDKAHLFDHSHIFNWDRRLVGDNITSIISAEMRRVLDSEGEVGQTFGEVTGEWDEEQWGDFLGDINDYDPEHELSMGNLRERVAQIHL